MDLSKASGVGTATLQRMEVMDGVPTGQVRTLMAIKEALEAAGVEFINIDNKPFYDATAPVRAKYGAKHVDLMNRIAAVK